MTTLTVELGDRKLSFDDGDFPLSLGGARPHVPLVGAGSSAPLAHFGLDEGDIFIQPSGAARDTAKITCNGIPVTASRWLEDGDLITTGSTLIRFQSAEDFRLVIEELVEEPQTRSATGRNQQRRPESKQAPIEPLPFSPRWQAPAPRRALRLSPRLIVAAILLCVLGASGWYVLTAQSVMIRTEPTADQLTLRGGITPGIGGHYLLRPGTYRLHAERSGYLPIDSVVEVRRGLPATRSFLFEPLGGTISITSRPVSGAAVVVDGDPVGTTPIDGIEVSAGDHTIEVRAALHRDFSTALRIEPGEPPVRIEAVLEPNWASVSVASSPAGAEIRLDRLPAGRTPATLKVEAGSHTLEVHAAGHKPASHSLQVVAGEAADLGVIALEPEDGRLAVISQPGGATVTIGTEYKGTTPLELTVPPATPLDVRVTLTGHASFATTVTVASEQRKEVEAILEMLTGDVVISSEPPGAEIVIDGEPRGRTGQTIELEAEPHEIELRLDGYAPHRTTIVPEPGVTRAVRATLEPVGSAGLPQTITSPQGTELVLVSPGRFTMGASRREPGRRANEVLREVAITKAFYLAVSEVTNREFREFKSGHLSGSFAGHNLEVDHHPVVNVSWEDAARYCNWLSAKAGLPPVYVERGGTLVPRSPMPVGYRLPTEAEWAWAARYAGSSALSKYGWGNSLPIPKGAGNYGDTSARGALHTAIPDYSDGYAATAPAGSFSANNLGLFNLGDNVAEWTQDIYSLTPSAPGVVEQDPTGPASGTQHVIRGASWMDTAVTELRLTAREGGVEPRPDLGFRVARSAE